MLQKWILLFVLFLVPLFGDQLYYLCIDGGASKTRISLLDQKGIAQQLSYRGVVGDTVYFGPSNILQIGKESLHRLFGEIFGDVLLTTEGKPLKEYVKELYVVGGFAGVPRELERQTVEDLFIGYGCKKGLLTIKCDGVLSSEVAGVGGISLIAGTGSVCMSTQGNKSIKSGGLGRLIDDGGSGYWIGIRAIRACLEEALGYGKKTVLSEMLAKRLVLGNLLDLIQITHTRFSPADIAQIAEDVFVAAYERGDLVALEILQQAAQGLAKMVSSVYKRIPEPTGGLYVWGGVVQNAFSDRFLPLLLQSLDEGVSLKIQNQGEKDATVLYAKKVLLPRP